MHGDFRKRKVIPLALLGIVTAPIWIPIGLIASVPWAINKVLTKHANKHKREE
jgi:hypothetical protein